MSQVASPLPRLSPQDLIRTLRETITLLHRPGDVMEVRILHTRQGTVSGYFDDVERLCSEVVQWDGQKNIYVTLNPVSRDLLARAYNRLKPRAKVTTSDEEILSRRWFPFDTDPVRPRGISATEIELTEALRCRDGAVAFLCGEGGFPKPALAMSGNGGHALWAVELPSSPEITELYQRALGALAARFQDTTVIVDTGIFNAARIWKLYGTIACKGDAMHDRPHRQAVIERAPDVPVPVTLDQLRWLAAQAPPSSRPMYSLPPSRDTESIDVLAYFQARGWYLKPLANDKHAVRCPWYDEHTTDSGPSETVLFAAQPPDRRWGFDCKHAHCEARTIGNVLAFFEVQPEGAKRKGARVVVKCLADVHAEPVAWLWRGRLAKGKLSLLIGDPGYGKSMVTLDIAARVTTGSPWPDQGHAPLGDVVVLTAEDGLSEAVRPRLDAMDGDPKRVYVIQAIRDQGGEREFDLTRDLEHLEATIAGCHATLVVIDPVSAYLGKTNSWSDAEVR